MMMGVSTTIDNFIVADMERLNNITYSPFYGGIHNVIKDMVDKYGNAIRSSEHLIKKAVYADDDFKEFYESIEEEHGSQFLEELKTAITHTLSCGNKIIKGKSSKKFLRKCHMCGRKICLRACAPYLAARNVRYHEGIILAASVNSFDKATKIMKEIKSFIENMDWSHLVVIVTPTHTGSGIIRVSTLKWRDLDNPLVKDPHLEASTSILMQQFPGLDRVTKTKTVKDISHYIVDGTDVTFSTLDLYLTQPEGRRTVRERGTKKGYEYDYETGIITHKTDKQRREDLKKQKGIVATRQIQTLPAGMPREILKKALTETAQEMSVHNERYVLPTVSPDDVLFQTEVMMATLASKLKQSGLDFPDTFSVSEITQAEADEFNNECGVGNLPIPENILEIEFTPKMLDYGAPGIGITEMLTRRRNATLVNIQRKIAAAQTITEYVEEVLEQFEPSD